MADSVDIHKDEEEKEVVSTDKVEHDYHDFSHESELNQSPSAVAKLNAAHRGEQNFPVKLHYMLTEMENDRLDNIVSWQAHGRCFVVHKTKEFVDHVLPLWFRQSKFPSFQRQLNLYGFKRLTTGRDKGGYYHELFLRGKSFLAHRIQRSKIKGTGARKPSSPETEPNFYLLNYLPPIKSENAAAKSLGTGPMAGLVGSSGMSMAAYQAAMMQAPGGAGSFFPLSAESALTPLALHGAGNANSTSSGANAMTLQQILLNQQFGGGIAGGAIPNSVAQAPFFSGTGLNSMSLLQQHQRAMALAQTRALGNSVDAMSTQSFLAGLARQQQPSRGDMSGLWGEGALQSGAATSGIGDRFGRAVFPFYGSGTNGVGTGSLGGMGGGTA